MLRLSAKSDDLVGLAVAVGVLDDRDAVTPLALRLHLVRVVDRLGDVEPAEVVPRHRDRLEDLRLRDEQLRLEAVGQRQVLLRFLGRERLLHLADRLAQGAPAGAGRVERDLGLLVLERLEPLRHAGPRVEHVPLVRRPADAALDQIMEAGMAPGAGVVAVRGVEDASLALRADPRPGLGAGLVVAGLEDVAVLRVVLGVDVRLVPGAERFEALDDRVIGIATVVSNWPVPCFWNWAPTRATYSGEFRKQNEAQCRGTNPPPPAT